MDDDDILMIGLATGDINDHERKRITELIRGNKEYEKKYKSILAFFKAVERGMDVIFGESYRVCPDREALIRMFESPDSFDRKRRETIERHIGKCETCGSIIKCLGELDKQMQSFEEPPQCSEPFSLEFDRKIKSFYREVFDKN